MHLYPFVVVLAYQICELNGLFIYYLHRKLTCHDANI